MKWSSARLVGATSEILNIQGSKCSKPVTPVTPESSRDQCYHMVIIGSAHLWRSRDDSKVVWIVVW